MATTIPFGSQPSTQNTIPFGGNTQPQTQQSFTDSLWNSIASGVKAFGSVTGANAIGEGLGTAAFNVGQLAQGKNPFNNPESQVNVPKMAGGVLQAGATVAGLGAAPATLGGAIGTAAGLGGVQGAGSSLEQGGSALDAIKGALGGAAIGGATAGFIGGVGKLLDYLPARLVQGSLPKLDPNNVDKVLTDTKLGTIDGMLSESKDKVATLGGQIQDILKSEGYANHVGNGGDAILEAASSFPKSEYTPEDVVAAARSVVPGYGKVITELQKGTATLADKNELRSAIDMATKKIFTDSPQVSNTKQLAASLASALRQEVQSTAPETQPVFSELSRELNLRNALGAASKKLATSRPVNLYSILSFMTAGLPAAIGEEFARSPGTSIAAGKAINAIAPAIQGAAVPIGSLAGGLAGNNSQSNQ